MELKKLRACKRKDSTLHSNFAKNLKPIRDEYLRHDQTRRLRFRCPKRSVRGEEKLAKERLRAEEEHRLLVAALQREEETRLILDNAILNLHLLSKMQPAEIAVILSTEVVYVEELILKNEQKEE